MKKAAMILIALLLCGIWVSAVEEGWLTSLEEAKTIAQKQDKDILIHFTGSDWCGWCKRLHKEIFDTELWQEEAPKKYVMVVIDVPRNKEQSEEQKAYNNKLVRAFSIRGYPTILVLDAEGKPYAQTGYQKGGPENYLSHLEEFSDQKVKRDELFQKVKKTPKKERLSVLEEVVKQLNEWKIGFAYPEIKEEIVSLDTDNKAGLKLEYASELTLYYHSREDATKSELNLKMVKEIDADKAKGLEIEIKLAMISSQYFKVKDWQGALEALTELAGSNPQGESGQKVYYYIAIMHYRLKDMDSTIESLETALKLAPQSKLAQQIQKTLAKMKEQQKKKSPNVPE